MIITDKDILKAIAVLNEYNNDCNVTGLKVQVDNFLNVNYRTEDFTFEKAYDCLDSIENAVKAIREVYFVIDTLNKY